MASYVVSYDLHDAEISDYILFRDMLRSLSGKAITESTWVIDHEGTAEGLKDALGPFLPEGSRLFVGKLDEDPKNHALVNPL